MQTEIQGYRLSPQQKRLWSLQSGGAATPSRLAILLEGELRADALHAALRRVVARHEILRTVFRRSPGMLFPLQVVLDESEPLWRAVQLKGYDAVTDVRDAETTSRLCADLFREEARATFDLSTGPLVHATLAAVAPRRHLLLLSLPALCADTRTLRNLYEELVRAYAAASGGDGFDDEPVQYVQFSDYQNELLAAEADEARGTNASALCRAAAPPTLPLESRVARAGESLPEVVTCALAPSLTTELEACASRYGVAAGTFLLACWQTLCRRLTGASEVSIHCVFDGREYEELQTALGLYADDVPLVCKFWEHVTFAEVLAQTAEALQEGAAEQAYLAAAAGDGEDAAVGATALPIQFEYAEQPAAYDDTGLAFSPAGLCAYVGRFKLKLNCLRRGAGHVVELHYDTAVYTRDYVERILGMFLALSERAARAPAAAVADLDILSTAERRQLLFEWNDTARAYPHEQSFQRLFEAQSARTPERVAVVCGEQRLTYAELNARANRLARYLRRLGAGPEVRVGVYVERSVEMLVGLLGVLKACAAYVPLDVGYPAERIAYMLQDAATPVLLSQSHQIGRAHV